MKTVTIQIGNSDDKLTQAEWCLFIQECDDQIRRLCEKAYFCGSSPGDAAWQNYAWIIDIKDSESRSLKYALQSIKGRFHQDSIAWTIGKTEFI